MGNGGSTVNRPNNRNPVTLHDTGTTGYDEIRDLRRTFVFPATHDVQ
jgi:hypothetical protein